MQYVADQHKRLTRTIKNTANAEYRKQLRKVYLVGRTARKYRFYCVRWTMKVMGHTL